MEEKQFKEYDNLVYYVTKKYKSRRDYQDIRQEAWLGLLGGEISYAQTDKSIEKKIYLVSAIKHWLIKYFDKDFKNISNVIALNVDEQLSENMKVDERIIKFKNEKEKIVYNMYNEGYTFQEIGTKLNITKAGAKWILDNIDIR